jgi:hypothetical protein
LRDHYEVAHRNDFLTIFNTADVMKALQCRPKVMLRRAGKAWSVREDQLLLKLIRGGRSATQVAVVLLRTTRAVRKRAEELRISWKSRRVHDNSQSYDERRSS